MKRSFYTPLRYPGGKGKLGPWIADLMRHNNISGGSYIEPYAGGAGAALYLLISGYVNHIVINDIDPAIYSFWWSILNNTEAFIEKIESACLNADEWNNQKQIIMNKEKHTTLEIGFAAFYLNRTNRSGIIKGGMIGGRNQEGPYKIDARFNKLDLVNRIRRIASYKHSIDVYNEDAVELMKNISKKLPNKALVYFDPPYYVKGSQLYQNHYKHDDHKLIASTIETLPCSWIVTYDNCQPIKELYHDQRGIEFSLRYSTHTSREVATELMFYGNLELHSIPSLTA